MNQPPIEDWMAAAWDRQRDDYTRRCIVECIFLDNKRTRLLKAHGKWDAYIEKAMCRWDHYVDVRLRRPALLTLLRCGCPPELVDHIVTFWRLCA